MQTSSASFYREKKFSPRYKWGKCSLGVKQ